MFAAAVGHRSTAAIDGDSWQGNHLSEPKRCSDKPGHLTYRAHLVVFSTLRSKVSSSKHWIRESA